MDRFSKGGLAIHTTDRLIAVSCNSAKIWVYAFALDLELPVPSPITTPNYDRSSEGFHLCTTKDTWSYYAMDDPLCDKGIRIQFPSLRTVTRRMRNVSLCLDDYGHDNNIPNIAFYNSDPAAIDDKVYLASTDIAGNVFVWDVWRGSRVFHTTRDDLEANDDNEFGWCVTCLDTEFSQHVFNATACYGTRCIQAGLGGLLIDNSDGKNGNTGQAQITTHFQKTPLLQSSPVTPEHNPPALLHIDEDILDSEDENAGTDQSNGDDVDMTDGSVGEGTPEEEPDELATQRDVHVTNQDLWSGDNYTNTRWTETMGTSIDHLDLDNPDPLRI